MSDAELTLCTVSFESRRWLALNRELTRRSNPSARFDWVVAENTPADSAERLPADAAGFRVIEGPRFEAMEYGAASYHHGAGMNRTLGQIRTRFALFLDPDFFILRPHWMRDVLSHMRRGEIAFLGAPWHPSRLRKLRYFPCAHCMFVDLERVPPDALDFRPAFDALAEYAAEKGGRSTLVRLDPLELRRRRSVGTSRDTGWRIYDYWRRRSELRVECLQPVHRPRRLRRWIERPLPDRLRLLPLRAGYFTPRGFRSRGLPDLEARGWEEFVWRDDPFGFHVRCHPKTSGGQSLERHYAWVEELIASLGAGE